MKFSRMCLVALMGLSFVSLAALAKVDTPAEAVEESSDKFKVSTGKYITGGILGSSVGFGIGHAVQGRYSGKGWIFTATEAAGLLLYLDGCGNTKKDANGYTICKDAGLALTGLGVMIGFHIWEIVDIWSRATPVSDEAPVVFVAPGEDKNLQLGLAWRF